MVDNDESLWLGAALNKDVWKTASNTRSRLRAEAPWFADLLAYSEMNLLTTYRQFGREILPGAAHEIVTQATNDFADLLVDLEFGRGRPATRAARSLFEHMINLLDVAGNPTLSIRYMAHESVTIALEAEAGIGLALLDGSDKRAEQHRLRKLARVAAPQLDAAIAQYGPGFRRSWSQLTLRDRARSHGHEPGYDYYRLASQILHGSLGGRMGIQKEIDGHGVHRIGPALSLLPLAFCEGVRSFREIVRTMATLVEHTDVTHLLQILDFMLQKWPEYRKAVIKVDRWLWPDEPPEPSRAILAVSRSGARRWYCYEPQLGLIARANPPSPEQMSAEQRQSIEELLAGNDIDDISPEDQWLTTVVAGVAVNPAPDARWINASAVLVPVQLRREQAEPSFPLLRNRTARKTEDSADRVGHGGTLSGDK